MRETSGAKISIGGGAPSGKVLCLETQKDSDAYVSPIGLPFVKAEAEEAEEAEALCSLLPFERAFLSAEAVGGAGPGAEQMVTVAGPEEAGAGAGAGAPGAMARAPGGKRGEMRSEERSERSGLGGESA